MFGSNVDRQPTLHGFVPGEVQEDYHVTRDGNKVTLTHRGTGDSESIALGFHDPFFWYELGAYATAARYEQAVHANTDRAAVEAAANPLNWPAHPTSGDPSPAQADKAAPPAPAGEVQDVTEK